MDDLPQTWRHLLRRALKLLSEGRQAAAVSCLHSAMHAAPAGAAGQSLVKLALGRARIKQRRYVEAEELLREAHAEMPRSDTPTVALARLLGLHMGKMEEALELVERAGGRRRSGPLQVVLGELLLERGDFKGARGAFAGAQEDPQSIVTAYKGMARCFNMEGIAQGEVGELERALFSFRRAAGLDSHWSGPCVNMGVVLGRLGRHEMALEAYEKALLREPSNPVIYYNLGTVLLQMGRHQEAVQALSDLLDICPDFPTARLALANVLGELREFDQAIALLLEELEVDDRQAGVWSSLGLAYICTGSPDRGEGCLHQALELDPAHFNALHNLINLYVAQGRQDLARQRLEQARALDPDRAEQIMTTRPSFEVPQVIQPEESLPG